MHYVGRLNCSNRFRRLSKNEVIPNSTHLRVESERVEHDEEQDGPELPAGDAPDRLWESDEGQILTRLDHIADLNSSRASHGAENAEHGDGGDQRGDEVQRGDDHGVDVHLVVELVVGAEHDEAAPSDAEGVEHLLGCPPPYL